MRINKQELLNFIIEVKEKNSNDTRYFNLDNKYYVVATYNNFKVVYNCGDLQCSYNDNSWLMPIDKFGNTTNTEMLNCNSFSAEDIIDALLSYYNIAKCLDKMK